jgi:hypothetical protein
MEITHPATPSGAIARADTAASLPWQGRVTTRYAPSTRPAPPASGSGDGPLALKGPGHAIGCCDRSSPDGPAAACLPERADSGAGRASG